jgi:uncharacterized membrane protein YqgA involved in biofilm formation
VVPLAAVHLTGTLINAAAVLAGTMAGTLLGSRFPERVRTTVMDVLGLATLLVGADAGLQAFEPPLTDLSRGAFLVILGSLLLGAILGEALRIEARLNGAGDRLKRRFGRGQTRFTEGFVVASLVFCVGPLTVLGSLQDGLTGDCSLLALKSLLDGFAALAFASVMGWGVGFSVLTILVFQGGLSLAAGAVEGVFDGLAIGALEATGGALILGIGLRLLRIREVPVANMLPALVLAPLGMKALEAALR